MIRLIPFIFLFAISCASRTYDIDAGVEYASDHANYEHCSDFKTERMWFDSESAGEGLTKTTVEYDVSMVCQTGKRVTTHVECQLVRQTAGCNESVVYRYPENLGCELD